MRIGHNGLQKLRNCQKNKCKGVSKHYLIRCLVYSVNNLTGSLTLPGSLPSAHSGERLASAHTGLEGRKLQCDSICPVWNKNLIAVLIKNLTNIIT